MLLMVFYCDRCNTKYSLSTKKWKGDAVNVTCKKCSNIFVVKAPAPKDPPAQPPPVDEEPWYVGVDGEQAGPMDLEELRRRVRNCPPEAEVYVWQEGFKDWVESSRLYEFRDLFPEPPFNLELEDVGIEDYLESLLPTQAMDSGPARNAWSLEELGAADELVGEVDAKVQSPGEDRPAETLMSRRLDRGRASDASPAAVPALPAPIRMVLPSKIKVRFKPGRRLLFGVGGAVLFVAMMITVDIHFIQGRSGAKRHHPALEAHSAPSNAILPPTKQAAKVKKNQQGDITQPASAPVAASAPTIDEIIMGLRGSEEAENYPELKQLIQKGEQIKGLDDKIEKMLKHLRAEGAKMGLEKVHDLANELRALRLRKAKISKEAVQLRGALPRDLLKRRPPAPGAASQPVNASAASQPANPTSQPLKTQGAR